MQPFTSVTTRQTPDLFSPQVGVYARESGVDRVSRSSRTICCRASGSPVTAPIKRSPRRPTAVDAVFSDDVKDYGHLPWGDPVYTHEAPAGEDGELRRHFHGRGRPPTSTLTDEQLDVLLSQCLQDFPKFGRRKIAGYLRDRGHHVPDRRLRESYVRVHGAPAIFGDRNIHRKRYHVAGANSLWHHDGQHGESGSMATRVTMTDLPWAVGLIRYKIVIHAFVDRKSHLVTGIQASNNNRGTMVLLLFHRCRSKHGTPSRLCGDHGTENLRVAEWMLENRGPGRGLYIFGR